MTESRKLEFTEGWIRGLDPAPQGKRVAYSDMVVQGLRLRVNDQGEKIFSVVYRLRGDSSGAPKTFTIGRYPDEYKIKGARDEALRVLPELKAGRDPKVAARIEREAQKKIAASQITLADAAPLYVDYYRHHKPGKDGKLGRRSWESEEYKLRVVCQNGAGATS